MSNEPIDTGEYMEIYDSVAGLKPEERAVAVVSTFLVEIGEKGKDLKAADILDAMVRVYATERIDDTKRLELKNKANKTEYTKVSTEGQTAVKQWYEDNGIFVVLMKTEKHFMYPDKLATALNTTAEAIKILAAPLIDAKIIYQNAKPEKPYYALTKEFKEKMGMK